MKRPVALLIALFLAACAQPEPVSKTATTDPAVGSVPRDKALELQKLLGGWGYRAGKQDGVWRANDAAALRFFAADWQLPAPGSLSDEVIAMLKRDDPRTKPADAPIPGKPGCAIWNPFPAARETVSWTGPCKNGRPDGKGVLTWAFTRRGEPLRDVYRGTLRAGKRDGHGVQDYFTEASYTGDFKDDRPHGEGVYMYPNGTRYEGGFRKGRFDGRGTLNYASGNLYVGGFRGDKRHGRGRFQHVEGPGYEGEWADDLPHGRGTLRVTFTRQYTGTFVRGCFRKPDGSYASFLIKLETCGKTK